MAADGVSVKASLTETQGLELVLGVGDRCTVTRAIHRPGSGYRRGSDSGETSIIVSRRRNVSRRGSPVFFACFSSLCLFDGYLTTPRPAVSSVSGLCACATSPLLAIPINLMCAGLTENTRLRVSERAFVQCTKHSVIDFLKIFGEVIFVTSSYFLIIYLRFPLIK